MRLHSFMNTIVNFMHFYGLIFIQSFVSYHKFRASMASKVKCIQGLLNQGLKINVSFCLHLRLRFILFVRTLF